MSLLLVTAYLGASPGAYVPQWSDEVFNWHQVKTFERAGFSGGYYSVDEEPAVLGRFYSHGPAYPLIFGSAARLFGWGLDSTPLMSVILTTLAVLGFILVARLDRSQVILLGLTLMTFWPMHLYMNTDMRVAFFGVIAIALAACFYRTIEDPDGVSPRFIVLFGVFLGLATLSKLTWAFLFIPYLLHIRGRIRLGKLGSLALAALLILAGFGAHSVLAAPFPNFTTEFIAAVKESYPEALALLVENVHSGVRDFFDLDHQPLWLVIRLQMLITIGWGIYLILRSSDEDPDYREGVLIASGSGLLLIATVVLYDVVGWRDYRLFAPALLMATLVLLVRRRFLVVKILLAGNLLVVPAFLGAYDDLFDDDRFAGDRERLEYFSSEIASTVKFDEQGSAWQNTILAPLTIAADPLMVAIPPGIGISWFQSPPKLDKIKSGYLLIDRPTRKKLGRRRSLAYVRTTLLGDLYINMDPGEGIPRPNSPPSQ